MSQLGRLTRISTTILRYRLDEMIDSIHENHHIPGLLGFCLRYSPTRLLPKPKEPLARRLRLTMEALGPVFIKFGQILSTRRDLLPDDYADELALLQDKVPPFPSDQAIQLIESSLGQTLDAVFAQFTDKALASASVAQVYSAQLKDGTDVVIKVIRPGIEKVIQQDLKLMLFLARLAEKYSVDARRLQLVQVIIDYEFTIMNELNLKLEGTNTTRLRRNFADSDTLYVPRVYWEYTRTQVLVLERVYGTPVREVNVLKSHGTNMKLLAERGVETFFIQVFEDNFFHADMHPGNIFIDITNPEDPTYIAIDCAIMGSLTEDDQRYLAQNLLAFFNRDYTEVVRLHIESGWVPQDTDPSEFEAVIRNVCEPIFEKPLSEISFGYFLLTLFQTAREFNMEVQPQLVLLQKTLLNIEGVGRELYPELNLWDTAKPFIERWIRKRSNPLDTIQALIKRAPELLQVLPRLPDLLINADRELQQVHSALNKCNTALIEVNKKLDKKTTRARWLVISGVLFLAFGCAYMLFNADQQALLSGTTIGMLAALAGLLLIIR
ncbi:MAG: ubiquinone biosynthesis regulatory protein kinase UbiB [Pseudomonadales bacterium]|nr:ubiquinone biosynthesis regulatory protein kinase UbiB [Pseudomonadales bacterium]